VKIHVNPKYYARGKTGKGKFCQRLVKAWHEMGINVTPDSKAKADIALNIGRMNYGSKAKVQVIRVGPANIDTNMNWRKINNEKALSVKKADAVVYQSFYAQKIYHKLVCKPNKPETVILNGADPRNYGVEPLIKTDPERVIFLASTRVWLKQKRLNQIIRAFLEAGIPKSTLYVCGDTLGYNKKYGNNGNIIFEDNVKDDKLAVYYRSCHAMIHLTYVDACPNSVVEAQVAGLPVICTDQGGTHELLVFGKVLKDKPFKYRPVNLNKPPKINQEVLIKAMKESLTWNYDKGLAKELYIQNIAKQYLTFFRALI